MTTLITFEIRREPTTERGRTAESAEPAESPGDADEAQEPSRPRDRPDDELFSLYVELL